VRDDSVDACLFVPIANSNRKDSSVLQSMSLVPPNRLPTRRYLCLSIEYSSSTYCTRTARVKGRILTGGKIFLTGSFLVLRIMKTGQEATS